MCSRQLLDHGGLGLGMGAPQHENADVRGLSYLRNDGIAECFPSFFCMAGGAAVFYRQAGIEQQHALLCPGCERSIGVGLMGRAQSFLLQFFEDIA